MKKPYVKPAVYFESFELSTSIATGCDADYNHSNTNFGNADSCALILGNVNIFTSTNVSCTPKLDFSQFCYHVPTADSKVFSS